MRLGLTHGVTTKPSFLIGDPLGLGGPGPTIIARGGEAGRRTNKGRPRPLDKQE